MTNLAIVVTIPASWVPTVLVLAVVVLVISAIVKVVSVSKNVRRDPSSPRSGPYTVSPDERPYGDPQGRR